MRGDHPYDARVFMAVPGSLRHEPLDEAFQIVDEGALELVDEGRARRVERVDEGDAARSGRGMIIVLIVKLLDVVEPHHSAKGISQAIVTLPGPEDLVVVEVSLEYSAALPFYTGRRALLVNGAVGYFSFASKLPEADGVFIDARELIRLWAAPRRVFLVVWRPPAESVVAALPPAGVHELGRYSSRWLYSNR